MDNLPTAKRSSDTYPLHMDTVEGLLSLLPEDLQADDRTVAILWASCWQTQRETAEQFGCARPTVNKLCKRHVELYEMMMTFKARFSLGVVKNCRQKLLATLYNGIDRIVINEKKPVSDLLAILELHDKVEAVEKRLTADMANPTDRKLATDGVPLLGKPDLKKLASMSAA